jgi:hypothetical protein
MLSKLLQPKEQASHWNIKIKNKDFQKSVNFVEICSLIYVSKNEHWRGSDGFDVIDFPLSPFNNSTEIVFHETNFQNPVKLILTATF